MSDATPQDAEVVKPREEMMENIAASREIEVLEDIVGEEAVQQMIEEASEELSEEGVEEEIQQEDPKSPVWQSDGQWVTSVKVNGEEVEVPRAAALPQPARIRRPLSFPSLLCSLCRAPRMPEMVASIVKR